MVIKFPFARPSPVVLPDIELVLCLRLGSGFQVLQCMSTNLDPMPICGQTLDSHLLYLY